MDLWSGAGPRGGRGDEAGAQVQPRAEARASHCIAIADAAPGLQYLHKASFRDPVPEYSVRISYVAHSAYLIQTRGGLSVVTDYPGFIGSADFIPDVVTMNHAHSSHFTPVPDPAIPMCCAAGPRPSGSRPIITWTWARC